MLQAAAHFHYATASATSNRFLLSHDTCFCVRPRVYGADRVRHLPVRITLAARRCLQKRPTTPDPHAVHSVFQSECFGAGTIGFAMLNWPVCHRPVITWPFNVSMTNGLTVCARRPGKMRKYVRKYSPCPPLVLKV